MRASQKRPSSPAEPNSPSEEWFINYPGIDDALRKYEIDYAQLRLKDIDLLDENFENAETRRESKKRKTIPDAADTENQTFGYHVTPSTNGLSILEHGLLIDHRGAGLDKPLIQAGDFEGIEKDDSIHFSSNRDGILFIAREILQNCSLSETEEIYPESVLILKANLAQNKKLRRASGEIIVYENIAPELITLLTLEEVKGLFPCPGPSTKAVDCSDEEEEFGSESGSDEEEKAHIMP